MLWREDNESGNPWVLRFMAMFHMANDSGLFRSRAELESRGNRFVGNRLEGREGIFLPLIEAKMLHQYDHRFGTYEGATQANLNKGFLPRFDSNAHNDPHRLVLPEYWVHSAEVEQRLAESWNRSWLLGWRDITRSVDERTVIASLIPRVAVGHTSPLLCTTVDPRLVAALYANLCSFALDYAARQKIGGTHLTYSYLKQLPVLAPSTYEATVRWDRATCAIDWLLPRVLELTYTAWDLESFAQDVGYDGPPFRWDPDRRALLRAELDAAFFHLYGISRDDADFILSTFPIVRRNDEKAFGEFRTRRLILERYDALAQAARTDRRYHSPLDPPPASPRVAHPPQPAK